MKATRFVILGLVAAIVPAIQAAGGIISEFAPFGGAGQPPYIELTITQPVTSLQLLILDANPFNEQSIKASVPISVQPGDAVVAVHQGVWQGGSVFTTQTVAVSVLALTGPGPGAARRLALFDTSDGRSVNLVVPPLSQWATTPTMPALLDVVTYSINGWAAKDTLGEPLIPLATGEAAARVRMDDGFTDDFADAPLSPGLVNTITPIPEPSCVMLLVLGATSLAMRRR